MLLLVLLVGIAGGAVLSAVAGARRSSTAYERFRTETLASDLDVAFDGPPGDEAEAAADAMRALPEVVALGRLDFPFIVPAGSGFYPYLDFLAAVSLDSSDTGIDRPRIVDGRRPAAADEMAIVETYAREAGLRVGDHVDFESFAPEQLEPLFTTGDAGPPAGPRLTFVVTAIYDAPGFLSESTGDFTPRAFLPPAFSRAHGDEVATYPGGFSLRLRRGAADTERVTATLREMFPGPMLEVTPASEVDRKIDSSIDVIVTALGLFALVATIAGTLAIGQSLARHFATHGAGDRSLGALGMTRAQRVATQAVSALPIAVLGAAVAIGASVAASPLMPVGVARRAEPDPGFAVDGPVLLVGAAATVAVVLVLSALSAAAATRRLRRTAWRDGSRETSRAMRALRRTDLPLPALTGVGLVVEPRQGTAWAVRSAVAGVVVGVTGLVAVSVFTASTDELVRSPGRYGAPFDAEVSGFSGDVLEDGDDALIEDPRVAGAGVMTGGLARIDHDEVNTYSIESLKGDLSFTLLEGHVPRGGAEVVLGTSTLEHAGVRLGDVVDIQGARDSLRAIVVGTAVFPVVDERSAPGRGVLLGPDDLERISSPEEINVDILIRWSDGVDAEAANAELAAATETEVFPPRLPSDVNNLREVKVLPRGLAAVLAILAVLAVLHALVSTLRQRRRDLAVLRSIGFDRRQLGSTLLWQATAIALAGVVLGLPLGLVIGRLAWRAVANGIGVVDDPLSPVVAVVVVAVAAVLGVVGVALAPSLSARNVSAAEALRSG
jgi:hypothetical protein